jgi:3-oxoacyl-[acyl-carrier protein] reductase
MLKDKVCLVTGSNRGIGRAIVEEYAKHGAIVYANARTPGSLDDIADIVRPIYFDVTDREACKAAFVKIMKEVGRIDCLVNNAGILVDTTITMLSRPILRDIFETNVFAVFEMMQLASRIMYKQKSGNIINVTSICGLEGGMRGQTAYSSSKGAVIALTKTAAKELGPDGIRVNAVAPGFIDTDMFRSGPAEIQKRLVDGVYLNHRVGEPKEVADVCVFLASQQSSYVNGQVIEVSGFAHI